MYYVYLGGELVFDALSDSPLVTGASISQSVNAAAYLDMTLAHGARPSEGQPAEVRWDGRTLFRGTVTEVSQAEDGIWDVSCASDVDRLNAVLVPPHSTDGTVGTKCPDTLSGYVQWLAETFNARMVGGFRVDVGQNQADLLRDGALSLTDDSWPSVAAALEDHVLSVGGYVDWEPHADSGTLNVWSDIHEAAGQLVDLGQNVTDITVTRTTEDRHTAIVPHSGSGDSEVTLDGITEAEASLITNAGMALANGAIYDPDAVAEWGYSESREDLDGVADRADLVRAAIARLRTMEGPQLTVQCHAVDMALYREGYAHLRVGQAVRVRAVPLGVDEYLAVQGMDLDLMDPANTSYTLGVTYDTLTGQQSAFLRGLNGSINHALDKADQAGKDAADALDKADQAGKDAADSLDRADQARKDAADALERADQTADEAAKGVQEAKDAAAAAGEKADELSKRADEMAGQITDIKVTQDQLSTKVEGAVEDAGAALKASSEVTQTVSGLKVDVQQSLTDSGTALEKATSAEVTANGLETKVTQAYESSTEALTKSAEAKQTADGLSATISKDYVSKEDAEKTYSTKAELSATSTSLTSKITETAKTAQAAQDKATEVEQTASGLSATITEVSKVASSASSKADAASTEAGEAKDAAEGAVTKATEAKATADGLSASVTKAQDTADSAVKAASTAQQTANEVKTTVETDYLKKADAESTYASKSSLTQTADSIRAEVTEAVTTANGAMEKASEVEQTADGLTVRLTTAEGDIKDAQDAADSAQSTANAAKSAAGDAAKTATNYLKFDSSGLCVGNMSGTLGYNALITGSAYQIRNGSTVLSSFDASQIELGKNSTSSTISMCGSAGIIRNDGINLTITRNLGSSLVSLGKGSALLRGTDTRVGDTASEMCETSVYGGKIYVGNRSRAVKNLPLQNVFIGSTVCNEWDSNDVKLFSESEIVSLTGRKYTEGDFVVACNGDARSNKAYTPMSAEYWSSSGWWVACGPSGSGGGGNMRINWAYFAVSP